MQAKMDCLEREVDAVKLQAATTAASQESKIQLLTDLVLNLQHRFVQSAESWGKALALASRANRLDDYGASANDSGGSSQAVHPNHEVPEVDLAVGEHAPPDDVQVARKVHTVQQLVSREIKGSYVKLTNEVLERLFDSNSAGALILLQSKSVKVAHLQANMTSGDLDEVLKNVRMACVWCGMCVSKQVAAVVPHRMH